MQLISEYNKGICSLLCVIGICSIYEWIVHLEDKKGITITDAFFKILNESRLKPRKLGVSKGCDQ